MKFILAVSVWVICSSIGLKQWLKVKNRSSLIRQTSLTLDCFINEIEYSSIPLDALIEKYSRAKFSKPEFILLCSEKLKSGYDFPVAWRESVDEGAGLLDEEEKSRLYLLGDLLGTSDSKSQCEFLKTQYNYFDERAKQAKEKADKCSSSFICSGIFIGFAFFIFIV